LVFASPHFINFGNQKPSEKTMQASTNSHFRLSISSELSKKVRNYFYWKGIQRFLKLFTNPPKPQSPYWVVVWMRFFNLLFALQKLDKLRRSLTKDFPGSGNYFCESWGGESMNASPNPEFNIGDRCSWTNAPDWWNPTGEKIRDIQGDQVWLDYWAAAIPSAKLILISSAPRSESSPANKTAGFPILGIAIEDEEVAA
jgi:hypothetical protein